LTGHGAVVVIPRVAAIAAIAATTPLALRFFKTANRSFATPPATTSNPAMDTNASTSRSQSHLCSLVSFALMGLRICGQRKRVAHKLHAQLHARSRVASGLRVNPITATPLLVFLVA
jgi:hypothetical protein